MTIIVEDQLRNRVCMVRVVHQAATVPGFPPSFFDESGIATEITGLRMQFDIKKTTKPEPNTCVLTISNLKTETRRAFRKMPVSVQILAGYNDKPRLLYKGDVIPGSYSRQNETNYDTVLYVGDGVRAFSDARISKSYGPGTTVETIFREAAASMNLTLPPAAVASAILKTRISTGEVVHGFSSDEFSRVLRELGFDWSIQNGQLQITGPGVQPSAAPFLIDADHGMVGSPTIKIDTKQQKPPITSVKMKLFPELLPGMMVRVASREVNGLIRIDELTHKGDTRGDSWHTEIQGPSA